jgi:hypothetical protein
MDESAHHGNALPPSTAATIHSLVDSALEWLASLLHLVALEGKEASIALVMVIGFGFSATVLLITGWLALVGCLIAALVESGIRGWRWALLLVALLHFAGAAVLMFVAIQRSRQIRFSATRHQLGLKTVATPGHE